MPIFHARRFFLVEIRLVPALELFVRLSRFNFQGVERQNRLPSGNAFPVASQDVCRQFAPAQFKSPLVVVIGSGAAVVIKFAVSRAVLPEKGSRQRN